MSNIDPQTVSSFGDEWMRFDQSGMSITEAQKRSRAISLFFLGRTCDRTPKDLIWVAEAVVGRVG